MLVLTRRLGQALLIGDSVEVRVIRIEGDRVVLGILAQVQCDAGATGFAGDGLHLECAATTGTTVADPAHCLIGFESGTAGFNGDLVGHDEA
jgi:hypothetical protein